MVSTGDFDTKRFDFVETSLELEPHENYDDLIEHKIFKFKYRVASDNNRTYDRRQARMISRFMERAKSRDPQIE